MASTRPISERASKPIQLTSKLGKVEYVDKNSRNMWIKIVAWKLFKYSNRLIDVED